MSLRDKAYSDLMRELWGSPDIWNTRKSYTQIAAKLGVDEETVRNRVKRLRDIGFLLGYRLVPNPALFGRALLLYASNSRTESPSSRRSRDSPRWTVSLAS